MSGVWLAPKFRITRSSLVRALERRSTDEKLGQWDGESQIQLMIIDAETRLCWTCDLSSHLCGGLSDAGDASIPLKKRATDIGSTTTWPSKSPCSPVRHDTARIEEASDPSAPDPASRNGPCAYILCSSERWPALFSAQIVRRLRS